jgi:hypothetical protein
VHLRIADLHEGLANFGVAGKMYREMGMWFWLEQVESTILAQDKYSNTQEPFERSERMHL